MPIPSKFRANHLERFTDLTLSVDQGTTNAIWQAFSAGPRCDR